jgi:hypothetical protein
MRAAARIHVDQVPARIHAQQADIGAIGDLQPARGGLRPSPARGCMAGGAGSSIMAMPGDR